MAIQFLNGQNINGDVTITGNVLLGGSSLDPKEITIQQIGVTSTETTAIMHDGNGVLKTRTLGAGAFGPTPVGAYLPLSAGSSYPLTGDLFIEGASTPKIKLTDTTNNLEGQIRVANNYMYIEADTPDTVASTRIVFRTDGLDALYFDGNQNATFAGEISQIYNPGNTGAFQYLKNANAGNAAYVSKKWQNDDAGFGEIWRNSSTRNSGAGNTVSSFNMYNTTLHLGTNDTSALALDNSQNATFAGTVETITLRTDVINTATTGTTQTAGNNSTLIATTAYADAAGGVQTVTTGNANTITIGGTPADPTVAANTGTVNSSSANLATGAQIQTAIDAATTGALKFVSEWDASGLNGGSPDLRLSATHIPGNYYIVSVAGGSTPNGSGTTPNSWAVGDWCIRADLATDTWQKIDNTQVGNVTGSGSFGQLAYWNSNSNITSESRLTFTSYGMSGRLLSVDGSINATDRVNVTGSATDLYFYEVVLLNTELVQRFAAT